MAEDKKTKINLDDWDNLPLDPDADDWDSPSPAPAPEKKTASTEPPLTGGPEADESGLFESDVSLPNNEETLPDKADAGFGELMEALGENPPETKLVDEFGDPIEAAPKDQPAASPPVDEFDDPIEAAPKDQPAASPPVDEFDDPIEAASKNQPQAGVSPKTDSFGNSVEADPAIDDFDAPIPNKDIEFPTEMPSSAPLAAVEADGDGQALLPKKVELDIDGIFLDADESDEPEEVENEPAAPSPEQQEEKEPAAEAAPVPAEDVVVKRHRFKILLIIGPAVLILAGLAFGAYKLFFSPPPPPPPTETEIVEPPPPPHVPEPGELILEVFYINIPGKPNDLIIELELALDYKDNADLSALKIDMVVLRDIIYRLTQSKGGRLATDPSMQAELRQELLAQLNLALGRPRLEYVRIVSLKAI